MTQLTLEDAEALGFTIGSTLRHNGEIISSIRSGDVAVSLTEFVPGTKGGWQPAHYHEHAREQYMVLRGYVVLAFCTEIGAYMQPVKHGVGTRFTVEPRCPHSLLLSPDAVLLTVTSGGDALDWHASPELDEHINKLQKERML